MSLAKTQLTEGWGTDDPDCGARSNPCGTIIHIIVEWASKNDRIIVGPVNTKAR